MYAAKKGARPPAKAVEKKVRTEAVADCGEVTRMRQERADHFAGMSTPMHQHLHDAWLRHCQPHPMTQLERAAAIRISYFNQLSHEHKFQFWITRLAKLT